MDEIGGWTIEDYARVAEAYEEWAKRSQDNMGLQQEVHDQCASTNAN